MGNTQSDSPLERDPVIERYKAGLDLSLVEGNLNLSVSERIAKLQAMSDLADELMRAGRTRSQDQNERRPLATTVK